MNKKDTQTLLSLTAMPLGVERNDERGRSSHEGSLDDHK